MGVGQGSGGRYLVPSGRGRIGTGGPRGARPRRSLGSSRSRDGGGSACTSGGGRAWDRGTGRRIPPAGRRPQPISERREGERVRRGRSRLAHCTRGLGEGGGHPGTAGSMGVRICGSGTHNSQVRRITMVGRQSRRSGGGHAGGWRKAGAYGGPRRSLVRELRRGARSGVRCADACALAQHCGRRLQQR